MLLKHLFHYFLIFSTLLQRSVKFLSVVLKVKKVFIQLFGSIFDKKYPFDCVSVDIKNSFVTQLNRVGVVVGLIYLKRLEVTQKVEQALSFDAVIVINV